MSETLEAIIATPSLIRKQWLSSDMAVREVVGFEKRFGPKHLMLACHAALPLVLTPELLNLIHINFLDDEQILWIAEIDFLLSPLCRPIGDGLYEVEPSVREVLLVELENQFGERRQFELAMFLLNYLNEKTEWQQSSEIFLAQKWTAQAYLNPNNVIEEMLGVLEESISEKEQIFDLPGQIRVANMLEILAEPLGRTSMIEAYQYLSDNSRVLAQILYGDEEKLRQKIRQENEEGEIEKEELLSPVILKYLAGGYEIRTENIEGTTANKALLPSKAIYIGGSGVVIGIIDLGCDFAHRNFRHSDGSTRLLAIWDQNGQPGPDSSPGYGKVYSQDEINLALQAADPYEALGYGPATDNPWDKGAHGTHVMDIASGNGNGTDIPGVAPEADLVFVHLDYSTSSLDNSITLVEAISYIFDIADDRPCVINISLGTNTGPHDGTNLVEQGIDALVTQQPNRAVVVAAGNSYNDGIHAADTVPQDGYFELQWEFSEFNWTNNEMELWYCGEDEFRLELLAPDGNSVGSVALGGKARVPDQEGNTSIYVTHEQHDPENGDNKISILMTSSLPSGIWTVRLYGVQVTNGTFHAWIEGGDLSPSRFLPPYDNSHTLGSLSCGHKSIVVGSYKDHKSNKLLSWFSSSGPTRDGRQKPEVSAPGEHIWAAHSRTSYGSVRKSGTAMAAPFVTGVTALMLAEARAHNIDLTIDQIRLILVQSASKNPPAGEWHERYGYGRIDDPTAAVLAVREFALALKQTGLQVRS